MIPRPRIRTAALLTVCLLPACDEGTAGGGFCDQAVRVADLPSALDEASGVALSRRQPGLLWIHNDSDGTPKLYAVSSDGTLAAEIGVPGAGAQSDWEDIAAGPCPQGDCLYIADIGDNFHERDDRAILRLPEPLVPGRSAGTVERFPFRYPDGPEDAEAMFVLPDTSVHIITKGRKRAITIYRYPPPLRVGERVTLEYVQQLSDGIAQLPDLVTGASAAPAGDLIAVRTYTRLHLYRLRADTLAPVGPADGLDLTDLAEPQGEGVALADDGTALLVGETGPTREPPFLARTRCAIR